MISHVHVTRRRLLTPRQAARMLSVDEDVVLKWCQSGVVTSGAEPQAGIRLTESDLHSLQSTLRPSSRESGASFAEIT
jgi:hypothetical protein